MAAGWIEPMRAGSNSQNSRWELRASYFSRSRQPPNNPTSTRLPARKLCDKSTVVLGRVRLGRHIPGGTISCMKLDGETRVQYLKIELKDIMVKKVAISSQTWVLLFLRSVTYTALQSQFSYGVFGAGELRAAVGGAAEPGENCCQPDRARSGACQGGAAGTDRGEVQFTAQQGHHSRRCTGLRRRACMSI